MFHHDPKVAVAEIWFVVAKVLMVAVVAGDLNATRFWFVNGGSVAGAMNYCLG